MEACELERAEVEKLFLELWQPLFVYACSALKTDSAAREAVRETFRFAFARSGALLTSPSRRVWLFLTLKYIIQNLRRSRAELSRLLLADYAYTQGGPERVPVSAREFLGEADFGLLEDFAFEGRPLKTAAAENGLSLLECQARFRRARRRLLARTNPGNYMKDC